jgi:hypothetical protein
VRDLVTTEPQVKSSTFSPDAVFSSYATPNPPMESLASRCNHLARALGVEALADGFTYNTIRREVVEARLQKYQGNDQQREATLKQLFAEAGCDAQHLSEQPV